jgi:molybdopterin-guanine dinucleotide biosynthesis protein B
MRVPIIAIVGFSNSGKTRVASGLVRVLSSRGYRVAAFKHAHHGHEPAPSGKDSQKFWAAGAQEVVVSSPGMVTRTVMQDGDLSLDDLIAGLAHPPDIVVAEGFKTSGVPKVLLESDEQLDPYPTNIIAMVSHGPYDAPTPVFDIEDMEGLATFVEQSLLVRRGFVHADAPPIVSLRVGGVPIPLKEFPASALEEIIRGFLRSLHSVPRDARKIEIHLDRE